MFVYVNASIAEHGDREKPRVVCLLILKSMDVLVKTSLRIPEHSEIVLAFQETACFRTQQALLSTCPRTRLSLDDIGGRLLILLDPILPSQKASNTVLRAFCMIDGKLEKTWVRRIASQ